MADEHRPTPPADEPLPGPDDERLEAAADAPTRVVPPVEPAPTGNVSGTPAAPPHPASAPPHPIEDIDVPRGPSEAEVRAAEAAAAASAAAAAAAAAASAGAASAGASAGGADGEPAGGATAAGAAGPSMRARAAERTAEGAKIAADRASQAASATVQALRDTDVHEIAKNTTNLIENTRPFFLTAFAIVFAFLAAVENHAAIGVAFAIGAVVSVLGAAYSREFDALLRGRVERRR
ncbi:hypothetical protein [Patulibacter americanus]|uniref:hypothetical protein n=1 Tax=Patulibacter americanus TaxID=588672 RepID=UPI0003B5512B|nr:hypothetical protein [Patulibacter americanus]